MNKSINREKGIGKVYRFTLSQLYKNKSNKIVFCIVIVLCLLSVPIMGLIMGNLNIFGGYEPDLVSVYKDVYTYDEYVGASDDGMGMRMTVQTGFSIFLLMLSTFSTAYIMRAIIDEKTSKLVELLMVSVSSKALIFGKILAVMTYIFSLLGSAIIAIIISSVVSGFFMDTAAFGDGIIGSILSVSNENLLTVVPVLLISLAIAYFVYSMIAALAGAGCSSIEEMSSAYSSVMLILMVGYMVPTIGGAFASKGVSMFLSLFPVTAPFICPTAYYMGDISIWTVIISWAIQIALLYVLYVVSGRVYDQLIIYKGSRIKLSRIFKMATRQRKGA